MFLKVFCSDFMYIYIKKSLELKRTKPSLRVDTIEYSKLWGKNALKRSFIECFLSMMIWKDFSRQKLPETYVHRLIASGIDFRFANYMIFFNSD